MRVFSLLQSKSGWVLAVICLASLAVFASTIWRERLRMPGWDTHVYCDAVAAHAAGKNPYLVENLPNTDLSFVYAPLVLHALRPLCDPPLDLPRNYRLIYLIALLVAVALWPRRWRWRDALLALSLGAAGFTGFYWTLMTGNISVFELVLLSTAMALIYHRKYTSAAVSLGIMASIKLLPLALLAPWILAPVARQRRVMMLVTGAGTLVLMLALSALFYPDLITWYAATVLGTIPNQHAAIHEMGMLNNPSLYHVGADTFAQFGGSIPPWLCYVPMLALIIALTTRTERRLRVIATDPHDLFVLRTALLWLVIVLAGPRLKPYSLILATLPTYVLVRRLSDLRAASVVFCGGLFALLLHNVYKRGWVTEAFPMIEYHQLFSALLTLGMLFWMLTREAQALDTPCDQSAD